MMRNISTQGESLSGDLAIIAGVSGVFHRSLAGDIRMKVLARTAPWLARFTFGAASLLLLMISGKFIADPVGAGAASGIGLTEALALTHTPSSFRGSSRRWRKEATVGLNASGKQSA